MSVLHTYAIMGRGVKIEWVSRFVDPKPPEHFNAQRSFPRRRGAYWKLKVEATGIRQARKVARSEMRRHREGDCKECYG